MLESTDNAQIAGALRGRQSGIRGDGTLPLTLEAHGRLIDAGAIANSSGSSVLKKYQLDVGGATKVRVIHKPTTKTGSVTARIYAALADGATEDTVLAAQALVVTANTMTAAELTLPVGCQKAVLEITIPDAGVIDYTAGVAEYSAK